MQVSNVSNECELVVNEESLALLANLEAYPGNVATTASSSTGCKFGGMQTFFCMLGASF